MYPTKRKCIQPDVGAGLPCPPADLSARLLVALLNRHYSQGHASRFAPINGLMGAVNRPLRLVGCLRVFSTPELYHVIDSNPSRRYHEHTECKRDPVRPVFLKERSIMLRQQRLVSLPLICAVLLGLLAGAYLFAGKRLSKPAPASRITGHKVKTPPDEALAHWTADNMQKATPAPMPGVKKLKRKKRPRSTQPSE